MKNFLLFIFFSGFVFQETFAQPAVANQQLATNISLVSSQANNTIINFIPGQVSFKEIQTPAGTQYSVELDNATPILQAGAPHLPKLTTSVVIPNERAMNVKVIDSAYTEYNNISIAPSKGTFSRLIDPASVPFTYGDVYATNQFYPKQLATLRSPYIFRDVRAQTVVVNPVQYNPATKVLRVYSKITVQVSPASNGLPVINPLVNPNFNPAPPAEFQEIYKHQFLNYRNPAVQARFTPVLDSNRMLIIAYTPFMDAMKPFIKWKTQEGIYVDMISIDSLHNNADSIKRFVANYYNTHPGFTYLLLVGDAAQVPSDTVRIGGSLFAGDSDTKYGYIVGNDHYPDIFVGRFSGESVEDIKTQVARVITYEKKPTMGNWFEQGVCVASQLGVGDDDEYDWQHEHNIRKQLLNYTYASVSELYDGDTSQGGLDTPGNPTASELGQAINNGVSVMNYTGHGNITILNTTQFSDYNVKALGNANRLPFIWLVGCKTGDFVHHTCLGETFMRSEDTSKQPIGAIANFSSTIDQYWVEPMEAQDAFNAILTENVNDSTLVTSRTFGGITYNGCMEMNDKYGSSGYDMTDTWVCFGDPSLMVRTAVPDQITATHAAGFWLGITSFQVFCNTEGAKVCLWANGLILGTGYVSNHNVTIDFLSSLAPTTDTLWVTITKFNHIPYQAPVLILDNVSAPMINAETYLNVYPNPSSGNTTISYTATAGDKISIRLLNTLGQIINVLADNEIQAAGKHNYPLQASNLAKGIYIIELNTGNKRYFRKLVIE